jgi:hypothetical protein
METSSRDRISVDLHGLKAMLVDRSQALAVSPSELVRRLLAKELGEPADVAAQSARSHLERPTGTRTRLCLRMHMDHAAATLEAARRAGMSPGNYVAGLVTGVPAILRGGGQTDHVVALTASNAELSTLSRNIYHLTHLLRQAEVGPALYYRDMLDTLFVDVRRHLALASGVLADLRPRHQPPSQRRP